MTEDDYTKSDGFKIPKDTSYTVRRHLTFLGLNGAVVYRPTKYEDVSEEFKTVAQMLGFTVFSNGDAYCFVNEGGNCTRTTLPVPPA
jgi:hypothetical protein